MCAKWAAASKEARKGRFFESQARKVLDDILESSGQGRMRNETTEAFLRAWVSSKEVSKSAGTARRYKHTIEEFLGHLGAKERESLAHVTTRDIESFRDAQKRAGRTASTVNMAVKTLRIPFNKAQKQGLIRNSPAAAVELIRSESAVRDPFTVEQVSTLLAVADVEWAGLILLAATAGLRLGDAKNLTWAAVDLDRKVLRYVPQKTKAGRFKPIEIVILPDLEEYLLRLPVKSHKASAPLFPTLSQTQLSGCNGLSARFQKLMHIAGIFAETDEREVSGKGRRFNNLTFHSLRHTFVTVMANSGVSRELRMKLAGHTSDAHDRYTHLDLATMRTALTLFPSFSARFKTETKEF
jgi:integrase